MIGSCLFYAFWKWFTEDWIHQKDGYLLIRKSKVGWWPHFLHMDKNGVITQWQPNNKLVWWKPWEILIYRGYIKKGDD